MLRNSFLEAATTKYLIVTVSSVFVLTIGIFAIILGLRVTELDKLTKFVDAVFKAMAIVLGMIWTLNRYYVGRVDSTRLRVDADVGTVRYSETDSDKSDLSLLIFRLDVVNTSAVLLPAYQQRLEIEAVSPSDNGTVYSSLYRWPDSGMHPGGPIEPNSWDAINDAIPIPASVRAVRMYIEIESSHDSTWTWHKTFDVSGGDGNEK
jgi:hypothetical protein